MAAQISQNTLNTPLLAIFASEARVAVLRVFMLDPLRAYYQRQIEAATGLPLRAVQRELERLTSIGLLYRREEGNRAYYQVDMQYPLFPDLRSIMLKMASPVDALRGHLAIEEGVRLVFLNETEKRVLIVTAGGKRPATAAMTSFTVEISSSEEFARVLIESPNVLDPFLRTGVDLLGRREDVVWRRIEAAGYDVKKGNGVP